MNQRELLALLGFVVLCFAAAGFGALFTMPRTAPGGRYSQIQKPSWTPPSWLFGPVWSALYLMMAVAAWWVWRQGGWSGPARRAHAVPGSTRPQRGVVRAVLRAPLAVSGDDRDRAALDHHSADRARLFPCLAARGVADGSLFPLGELRVGAQLHDLAAGTGEPPRLLARVSMEARSLSA